MANFPPEWFASLVCPDCRESLTREPDGLHCPRCKNCFPFEQGIPKLWPPSRAAALTTAVAAFCQGHQRERGNRFCRALLPPSPICDPHARQRVRRWQECVKTGLILNLGSKATDWGQNVVNLDLVRPQGPAAHRVDVLGDLARLPFATESVDGVICTNVLEHVADARECLAEIKRVVKVGGHVLVGVPFIFPQHPDPLDCHRWTLDGLRRELNGFAELEAGTAGGPFSALVAVAPACVAAPFSNFFLFNAIRCGLGWLLWPVKFLDYLALNSAHASNAAATFYFLGRKKNAAASPAGT